MNSFVKREQLYFDQNQNENAQVDKSREHDQPFSQQYISVDKNPIDKISFRWTYEEHAKYVYFLQKNKLKIKSKSVRKSNAFFKQMERFIISKKSLQCRSHHQKYQSRYKFPHRIIVGEKKHIPAQIYNEVIENSEKMKTKIQQQYCHSCCRFKNSMTSEPKQFASVSCQTQFSEIMTNSIKECTSSQLIINYCPFINSSYGYYPSNFCSSYPYSQR